MFKIFEENWDFLHFTYVLDIKINMVKIIIITLGESGEYIITCSVCILYLKIVLCMCDDINHSSLDACLWISVILCLRFSKDIEISKKITCFLDINKSIIKVIIITLGESSTHMKIFNIFEEQFKYLLTCSEDIHFLKIYSCMHDHFFTGQFEIQLYIYFFHVKPSNFLFKISIWLVHDSKISIWFSWFIFINMIYFPNNREHESLRNLNNCTSY